MPGLLVWETMVFARWIVPMGEATGAKLAIAHPPALVPTLETNVQFVIVAVPPTWRSPAPGRSAPVFVLRATVVFPRTSVDPLTRIPAPELPVVRLS